MTLTRLMASMPTQAETASTVIDRLKGSTPLDRKRAEAMIENGREKAEEVQFNAEVKRVALKEQFHRTTDSDSVVRAGINQAFNMVVTAAVTLIVGIFVFSQISDTMPTPANNDLANATDTVESTTGDAFTLGAVAIIVLVASVILGLVSRFGGNGGRRM